MEIKFIEFKKVVGEKYLGIATICLDGKIYLRYKVNQGKEGKGYFFKEASYKVGEEYLPSFVVDSNYTCQKIESVLRENMKSQIDELSF